MIDALIDLDRNWFLAIHQGTANAVFDVVLPFFREKTNWVPLYLLFAFMAIYKFRLKGLYIVLAAAITVLLADQFAAGLMKPTFERLRPCNDDFFHNQIRQLVHCGGGYSFISAHATNHFALAIVFTWFFRKVWSIDFLKWVFFLWASIIAYAQVYVGVHYPFDVIVGALSGLLIGSLVVSISKKIISIN
ncbi:phosphatase PAP2 family protein [Bacteroidia bacterium]|nr:phosphatase PAP2 family protein [Bacteroidia bacterium]MDB9881527.1 phosphatase PAP2 family protein [Bacteroidia bacterium]